MFYKIIDVLQFDQYESDFYTSKEKAIADCKSEFSALSEHDKSRRRAFYVAAFQDEEATDHDIIFTAL